MDIPQHGATGSCTCSHKIYRVERFKKKIGYVREYKDAEHEKLDAWW